MLAKHYRVKLGDFVKSKPFNIGKFIVIEIDEIVLVASKKDTTCLHRCSPA